MSSNAVHYLTVAAASAEHPRQSEGAILERKDGKLLLVWQEYIASERGGGDDAPNYLAALTSSDGGFTWGDKRILIRPNPDSTNVYSPSLLRLPNDEILLTYYENQVLERGKPVVSRGLVCRSQDEGDAFGPATVIWDDQPFCNACATLRRLSTGRLINPVDRFLGELWTPADRLETGCLYSDDDGYTWTACRTWLRLPLRGCMESSVVELRNGRLLMTMRTQLGAVFQSWADDGGETWAKPQTTGLRAPESCPRIEQIPSTGDLLLIWNHSQYDPDFYSHYGKRTPLTAAISTDEGQTWGQIRAIEDDPNRAFTNPGCCFTQDNRLILNYWTCPYDPTGRMRNDQIDLKLALIDIDWFYD
jgi:sialidase-1